MRRHCLGLGAFGLGSVLLGAWLLLVTDHLTGDQSAPIRSYTVAQIRTLLRDAPDRWTGRIVVVRAMAEPCPWWGESARLQHCASRPLMLFGAPTEAPAYPLPLVRAAPQPLWSFLHGLPVIGDLLFRSSTVPMLVPARFRVRMQVSSSGSCTGCYEALLLDASP